MNLTVEETIESLENQIAELEIALKVLRASVGRGAPDALRTNTPSHNNVRDVKDQRVNYSDYQPKWGYRNKYVYLLKKIGRFAHMSEVADIIIELDGLKDVKTTTISSKLSSALTDLKKSGDIVKIQKRNNNMFTYWGKPDWANLVNGEYSAKDGYAPNENYPKIKWENKLEF